MVWKSCRFPGSASISQKPRRHRSLHRANTGFCNASEQRHPAIKFANVQMTSRKLSGACRLDTGHAVYSHHAVHPSRPLPTVDTTHLPVVWPSGARVAGRQRLGHAGVPVLWRRLVCAPAQKLRGNGRPCRGGANGAFPRWCDNRSVRLRRTIRRRRSTAQASVYRVHAHWSHGGFGFRQRCRVVATVVTARCASRFSPPPSCLNT